MLSGFAWGLIQGNVLLVAAALLASRAIDFSDFGLAWAVALVSEVLISFLTGLYLADFHGFIKTLLLSTFVAIAYSMSLVNLARVSISVSSEQGYAQLVFFSLSAFSQFFGGILAGSAASAFSEFHRVRSPIPLTRRVRRVVTILVIVLSGLSGLYEASVLGAPNFSVTAAPSSLSAQGSCNPYTSRTSCPLIVIPFKLTVNSVRGYVGTVMIFNTDNAGNSESCSPVSLHLPTETSSSCQITTRAYSGTFWTTHMRVSDGNIIHDAYVYVILS